MMRLERRHSWYRGWIDGDRGGRDALLRSLRNAISDHRDDLQTNNELLQFLTHSLLHQILPPQQPEVAGDDNFASDYGPLLTSIHETEQLLLLLMNRIRHAENVPGLRHRRELQCRSILTCLMLLQSYGNGSLPERVQQFVQGQFEQLPGQMQLDVNHDIQMETVESYRKIQILYCLCIAATHATSAHATPPRRDLRSLIQYSLSSPDEASFHACLGQLEHRMETLGSDSEPDASSLLLLHEFCSLCSACHLLARVGGGTESKDRAQVKSEQLAEVLLQKLCVLLENHKWIPLRFDDVFHSAFVAEPFEFNGFVYYIGLLDVASFLVELVPIPSTSSDQLVELLRTLAQRAKEPMYRCKAIEALLRFSSRELNSRRTDTATSLLGPDATDSTHEISIVSEYLSGSWGHAAVKRRWASVSSNPSQLHNKQDPEIQDLATWHEDHFIPTERARGFDEISLDLIPSPWYRKIFQCPERFITCGLDPHCHSAFLLSEESLKIFSLRRIADREVRPEANIKTPDLDVADAVLSDSYAAMISNNKLVVYAYGFGTGMDGRFIGEQRFAVEYGRQWNPHCITMHEDEDFLWIAVGERILREDGFCAGIETYRVDRKTNELNTYRTKFERTLPDPFSGDYLKMLSYSADGSKLTCVTINNRLLVWDMSRNGQPLGPPSYHCRRYYTFATNSYGMMSATTFKSPMGRPYVLCLTSPSSERAVSKCYGEWSTISPLNQGSIQAPAQLTHNIEHLRDAALAGAVTSRGDMIAVREWDGAVKVFPLSTPMAGQKSGGICCPSAPLTLGSRLCKQQRASPTSIRFEESKSGLFVVAIDVHGKLIRRRWAFEAGPPTEASSAFGAHEMPNTEVRYELPSSTD